MTASDPAPSATTARCRTAPEDRLAREVAAEVVRERAGGGVALRGVLGQALERDGLQVDRQARDHAARVRRLVVDHPGQQLRQRRVRERGAAGQQLVQHGPEAVDVGAAVDGAEVAARLLGRDVLRRAEHGARAGEPGIHGGLARQPEVHDDGEPAAVLGELDQHVGGRDVAVHDAEPVGFLDRLRHVSHHGDLLVERHPRGGRAQRLTGDELERDVRPAVDLADLVDAADMGVIDAGLCARLAREPDRQARVGPQDELDGDDPAEPAIAGLVDRAHAAVTEQVEQLVAIPAGDRRLARERCCRHGALVGHRVDPFDLGPVDLRLRAHRRERYQSDSSAARVTPVSALCHPAADLTHRRDCARAMAAAMHCTRQRRLDGVGKE
jgi:hypothetical protein